MRPPLLERVHWCKCKFWWILVFYDRLGIGYARGSIFGVCLRERLPAVSGLLNFSGDCPIATVVIPDVLAVGIDCLPDVAEVAFAGLFLGHSS